MTMHERHSKARDEAFRCLDRVQPAVLTVRLSHIIVGALVLFSVSAVAGMFYRVWSIYETSGLTVIR